MTITSIKPNHAIRKPRHESLLELWQGLTAGTSGTASGSSDLAIMTSTERQAQQELSLVQILDEAIVIAEMATKEIQRH
jgi:hypothetical protein